MQVRNVSAPHEYAEHKLPHFGEIHIDESKTKEVAAELFKASAAKVTRALLQPVSDHIVLGRVWQQ